MESQEQGRRRRREAVPRLLSLPCPVPPHPFVPPVLSLPSARSSQSNGSRRFSLRCRVSAWMTACHLQSFISRL